MKKYLSFKYSIILTLVIGVLLLIPMPQTDSLPTFPNSDKFVHAFLFLILTILLFIEGIRTSWTIIHTSVVAVLWPMMWGGALELLQQYTTTYRSGSWMDWIADLIGIAMGILLAHVWKR